MSAALYIRGYVDVGDSYSPNDSWLSFVGFRYANLISAAPGPNCWMATSIPRPTDGRKGDMTVPPAWPEIDEHSYDDGPKNRWQLLDNLKRELASGQYQWDTKKTQLFEVSTWSSSASGAAEQRVDGHSGEMQSIYALPDKAMKFYSQTHATIVTAKNRISKICNHYQSEIERLNGEKFEKESDRSASIDGQIQAARRENTDVVNAAADS